METKQRNVMVILCDQLRKDFLPIYGGKAIDTPNIDRLAADGVVFDKCITQSTVCAPARATMMTGRYVSDHKVWTNDVPFRDGVEYIAERMNELGYGTAAFGKLHHTPGLDLKGFGHARLMEENRLKDKDHYYKYLKALHPEAEHIFNLSDDYQFIYEDEAYYERYIADETIKYLEANKDRPTFTWVSFQGPHTPYDPPARHRGKVRSELIPEPINKPFEALSENAQYRSAVRNIGSDMSEIMRVREAYAEMIIEIDEQIGRIMEWLKDNDLYEQTTIMFSADHGDLLGDMGLGEKGPFQYESQLGIPMILSNHPSLQAGTRSNVLVGNIDIPGTVLVAAGAAKGIGYSKSLLGLLNGSLSRTVNYSEFCDAIKTVENERYRYSYCPFDGHTELYDMVEDPCQQVNLSGDKDHMYIENQMLKAIIEFGLVADGVHIEAQDMVPSKQDGLANMYPEWKDDFKIVFPLPNMSKYRRIEAAGLDSDYNEFCQAREVLAAYGKYWEDGEYRNS